MSFAKKASNHGPSFLRWAGSKRQSIGVLSKAFPGHDFEYMEPFAGSAALFFALSPASGILADLNAHLINAMNYVRTSPKLIHEYLCNIKRNPETFYSVRCKFNTLNPEGIEAAVYFIYLNRNCFNGLWRTNSKGQFNVPYGGERMAETPPIELFEECSKALQRCELRHQDFRQTIKLASDKTFIFADPPYFLSAERTFIEYGQKSFGARDLNDLIYELNQASMRGARIAFTYHAGAELPCLGKHWRRVNFDVTRNVGGFSGKRKKQGEILYLNRPIENVV